MAEIKINFDNLWKSTKNTAKKIKDSVVDAGKSTYNAIKNADEEKIELIMKTKNVDRNTAKKILKEFRDERDKESVKSLTIDNLKR